MVPNLEAVTPGTSRGYPALRVRISLPRRVGGPRVLVAFLAGFMAALVLGSGYRYHPLPSAPGAGPEEALSGAPPARKLSRLRSDRDRLRSALQKKVPRGIYIVIDQTQNRLYLRRDGQLLLEAVCSAGSGMILKEQDGGRRKWVFDTPRGFFHVRTKVQDPIWKKPDWAFLEEGQPIPRDPSERFEEGVLGEYALYFGNGYLIHGTLYERLLGRSVSHGCIRLGREDLRRVYETCPVGTPIFIY